MSSEITQAHQLMRSIIQRIATGPELSKNISYEEARDGTEAILTGSIDPVQAAIFFIALRMKRETLDEFKGVLAGIREHVQGVVADVDDLLDLADPFDGYNRTLPAAPFLPALLAELGVPVLSHGLDSVGPKYGVTHRHVLQAAGVAVDLSPQQAAKRLADPSVGWSYLDQSQYLPALHNLIPLRTQMVKRSVLTTVEVLAKPMVANKKTHFMTGFVHKPYPPIYAMLARHVGFDSALILRGVEGGVIPSLRQEGKYFSYHDRGEEIEVDFNPAQIGIQQSVRSVPLPDDLPTTTRGDDEIAIALDIKDTAIASAQVGLAALAGEKGPTYDSLLLSGALALKHVRRLSSLNEAAKQVRGALDSGKAAARIA